MEDFNCQICNEKIDPVRSYTNDNGKPGRVIEKYYISLLHNNCYDLKMKEISDELEILYKLQGTSITVKLDN